MVVMSVVSLPFRVIRRSSVIAGIDSQCLFFLAQIEHILQLERLRL